ncbi:MAG: hypothetical protein SFT91_01980, partial [Rickettsiaceae bacterium]|nr:hypothetical protein [Rickettsiaceae bacterium]
MKKIISVFLISCLAAYGATAQNSNADTGKSEEKKLSYTEKFNNLLYEIITWNPFKDPAFLNYILGIKEEKKEQEVKQDTSKMEAIMSKAGTIEPNVMPKELDKENFSWELLQEGNSANPTKGPTSALNPIDHTTSLAVEKNLNNNIKDYARQNIMNSDLLTPDNNDSDFDSLSDSISSYLAKEKLSDHFASESDIYKPSTNLDKDNQNNMAHTKKVADEIGELASAAEKEAELSNQILKDSATAESKDIAPHKSEAKNQSIESTDRVVLSSESPKETLPNNDNTHSSAIINKDQAHSPSSAISPPNLDKVNNQNHHAKDDIANKFKHGALKLLDKEQVRKNNKADKELSAFIEDEIQDLLLPEDDVVLGKTSSVGALEITDSYAYLKLFWKNFYKFYSEDARNGINKYIAALSKEHEKFDFEEAKILAEEYVLAGDIEKLRVVVDNSEPNIIKYSECDFCFLCFTIDVDQYNPAYYIVMRGASIRDILFDASRGNIAA